MFVANRPLRRSHFAGRPHGIVAATRADCQSVDCVGRGGTRTILMRDRKPGTLAMAVARHAYHGQIGYMLAAHA